MNKDKKKNGKFKAKSGKVISGQGVPDVGGAVRRGTFKGTQAKDRWRRQRQREGLRVYHEQ